MTAARSSSNRTGSTGVEILADAEALAHRAAEEVVAVLGGAMERRGRATWVLSGGSTPRRLYELLARRPEALDWRRVALYWGDERCVEPTSAASNFRLVRDTLLAALPVVDRHVHRVRGELPAVEAARRYAVVAEAALSRGPFDLVLLGLGEDGHVASLFPGALPPPGELAAAVEAPLVPRRRVTLTPTALRQCRHLVFLVCGGDKAPAVARALAPAGEGSAPSGLVRPLEGRTLWLLDGAAAADARLELSE